MKIFFHHQVMKVALSSQTPMSGSSQRIDENLSLLTSGF